MAGLEADVQQWVAARGQPDNALKVAFLRMDDDAAVLGVSRPGCSNGHDVQIMLAAVEESSFFVEGIGDVADEVEDWLTVANSTFSDRSNMTIQQALNALVVSPPSCLTKGGASSSTSKPCMEDEADEVAMEDDDDHDLLMDEAHDDMIVEAAAEREDQRAADAEDRKWESVVNASSSQGSRQASQVLMREMRLLLKLRGDGSAQALEIEMIEDSLYRWSVKMHADGFPDGCPLKGELQRFAAKNTSCAAAVVMEVVFPDNYPMSPPFIRVVRPRFQMHTGHVTIGGSICMELLTPSGWLPSVSLENVFVSIRSEMIEGGGRLDLANCRDYSVQEAKEAFNRVASRYGWLK